ncbi:4Fe-4S binding protein [Extibacter muris]|uniref:4Fe-4S binding protein n=1 Tax=Extibacter muris TaxID=1796622 RepID=UPI001D08751C|nr:4Fe-4S binding protein [Extibacter muris]MCB6201895.1 4Fe-4S binding protein [Extibacter muris]MCQ4663231.1 4Fe-4S binding protein [Extibacter muris]MCQ4692491.1 4Fe-4S binding protein [Extibacter muris]
MIKAIRNRMRLCVQIAFTAVTNGYLFGFLTGKIYTGPAKAACVPGLNCYSCPGALGSCPIGSLQAVLGSRDYKFSFYVVGFLIFFGSLFGRFICGWLCPFGLIQDLLYKIPFFRKRKNLPGHKVLKWLKYVILVLFVLLLPLLVVDIIGQGSPWFCQYICPSGTLTAGVPLVLLNESLQNAVGGLFIWKVSLLAAIIILSLWVYRPFCKYLCPLGAVYSFFNPVALYRYRIEEHDCIKCGKCRKACKMDIKVWEQPNSLECIRCGDCIKACPANAIKKGKGGCNETTCKKN